jgi:predicted hydrolase (HD superfamily)
MGVTSEEAKELLQEWVDDPSLARHCRVTSALMERAAHRYGRGEEEAERWSIAGLLHDADYERWPDEHPQRVVAWLKEREEPEIAHTVSAHHTKWGVAAETQLDRALLACDELGGFVVAYAQMRPDGLRGMSPKGVRKKLRDKSFAAGVDRDEVAAGFEALGVEPGEHIAFVIEALNEDPSLAGMGAEPAPAEREAS